MELKSKPVTCNYAKYFFKCSLDRDGNNLTTLKSSLSLCLSLCLSLSVSLSLSFSLFLSLFAPLSFSLSLFLSHSLSLPLSLPLSLSLSLDRTTVHGCTRTNDAELHGNHRSPPQVPQTVKCKQTLIPPPPPPLTPFSLSLSRVRSRVCTPPGLVATWLPYNLALH